MSKSSKSNNAKSGLLGGLFGLALGAIGGFLLYKVFGNECNKDNEQNLNSDKIEEINEKSNNEKEMIIDNKINAEESDYLKTLTQCTKTSDNFEEMISCPITCNIMKDPVITPNGISYEKLAICDWLSKNNYCPITKKKLSVNELTPNYKLKEIIDNYLKNKSTSNVFA